MIRFAAAFLALVALTGCDILFPEDPRLGAETSEECAARVAGLLGPGTSYDNYTDQSGVPIFTFDITKLGLEEIQALMVPGSDDTAGSELMKETNETSTAVARFMASDVDDKGAFFMARDPALYRVKGALQAKDAMVASGCERQGEDMRLIMVDVVPERPELEPSEDTEANSGETDTSDQETGESNT